MSVLCCLDVASNLSRAKRHKMEIHMLPFTRHCFAEPSQTCPWAAHISPQRPAQTIVIRAPVGAPLRWLHYTLRFLEMRPQVGLNRHKTYLKTILYVYIYVCVYHILYNIYIYICDYICRHFLCSQLNQPVALSGYRGSSQLLPTFQQCKTRWMPGVNRFISPSQKLFRKDMLLLCMPRWLSNILTS